MEENKSVVSELEMLLLDFLEYRKQQRTQNKPEPEIQQSYSKVDGIPAEIGRGWPYYKALKLPYTSAEAETSLESGRRKPSVQTPFDDNGIIQTFRPIIEALMNHFEPPRTAHSLRHIADQVIAKAMVNPDVAAIMRTSESTSWGRAQLLQTIVELMIVSYKSHTAPS